MSFEERKAVPRRDDRHPRLWVAVGAGDESSSEGGCLGHAPGGGAGRCDPSTAPRWGVRTGPRGGPAAQPFAAAAALGVRTPRRGVSAPTGNDGSGGKTVPPAGGSDGVLFRVAALFPRWRAPQAQTGVAPRSTSGWRASSSLRCAGTRASRSARRWCSGWSASG